MTMGYLNKNMPIVIK